MYTFTREVSFKTMADGLRAAPVVAGLVKYYKEKHGAAMRVMRPVGGSPVRIRFVTEMPSMDAYAAMQIKSAQDPAFQGLLAEMAPLVDGSRTTDDIWWTP